MIANRKSEYFRSFKMANILHPLKPNKSNWIDSRVLGEREGLISQWITNKGFHVGFCAMIHQPFKNDEERYALYPTPLSRFEVPSSIGGKSGREKGHGKGNRESRKTPYARLKPRIRLFFGRLSFSRPFVGAAISRALLTTFDIDRVRVQPFALPCPKEFKERKSRWSREKE